MNVTKSAPAMGTEPAGRADELLARAAEMILAGFAPREIADFAGYWRRVIANTGSGSPEVWARAESRYP